MFSSIPFRWLAFVFAPELRGLTAEQIEQQFAIAKQASLPRIRAYAGWALLIALLVPFLCLLVLCYVSGLLLAHTGLVAVALAGLGSLSASLLYAVLMLLILLPALKRQSTAPCFDLKTPANLPPHAGVTVGARCDNRETPIPR